jgi:SAM-dependent methyltransferase
MVQWAEKLSKIRSRQGLYPFLEMEFSQIPENAVVLTIGSGGVINELLYSYSENNSFNVNSFDIDQGRKPDIVGDICTHEFDSNYFDYIVICEVLEHVHSPHLAISNLFKTLKPGGKLILTTPFTLPIHEAPRDYYRYTKYGLEFLLREFSEVKVMARNSYFEAIDVLWLRTIQSENKRTRMFGLLAVPFVFLIHRPFTLLFKAVADSEELTTGYNATAYRPVGPIS